MQADENQQPMFLVSRLYGHLPLKNNENLPGSICEKCNYFDTIGPRVGRYDQDGCNPLCKAGFPLAIFFARSDIFYLCRHWIC